MNWHQMTMDKKFEITGSSATGLSMQVAAERLTAFGYNELLEKRGKKLWQTFLLQFKDFMIIILLVAALLAGITGEVSDMLVILAIVLVNAGIGFVQEYNASKALEIMKKMDELTATVMRNGSVHTLVSRELVTGDIVLLEAGYRVPPDLRLFETLSLYTNT